MYVLSGILPKVSRLWMLLTIMSAFSLGTVFPASADDAFYSYGEACREALPSYRRGWAEILQRGRWTEAERLYRDAVAKAPNCVIAKSVLARITIDAVERRQLMAEIQATKSNIDSEGALILEPYVRTLRLISARETGVSLPDDFSRDLRRLAASNYRLFLDSYPEEWAVRIEYIEWIHAEHGPGKALEKIGEMAQENLTDSFRMSYFPASFHAELGHFEQATELAQKFVKQLGPGDWPQAYYIKAFIAYESGDYIVAQQSIRRALQLDPRHLIADRLSKKINRALALE